MNRRRELLAAVFEELHAAGITFCVSRNASEVFVDGESDVDLTACPSQHAAAIHAMISAATRCGYRLAYHTRFTNHCLLFHGGGTTFMRIDLDGDIRWRIFPVIKASEMLSDLSTENGLPVPTARAEAMVLVSKIAWMGHVSERYLQRLRSLREMLGTSLYDEPDLKSLVDLGIAGDATKIRGKLLKNTVTSTSNMRRVCGYLMDDARRFARRHSKPPGIYIQCAGSSRPDTDKLMLVLKMAFPNKKTFIINGPADVRLVKRTLFKAGMVIDLRQSYQPVAVNSKPPKQCSEILHAQKANRFQLYMPGNGKAWIGHEASGHLAQIDDEEQVEVELAATIGACLADSISKKTLRCGKMLILVGLDGAGKTTFARTLSHKIASCSDSAGIAYFHWLPKWTGCQFPWPSFVETPRKNPEKGMVATLFSTIRLAKNILNARLVYHGRLKPMMRKGRTVVVDRFLYNYWLDPTSLRYSGPQWLINLAARFIPRADYLICLEADADTLLSRKQELTKEQIEKQKILLSSLPLLGSRKIVLDARKTPEKLADEAWEIINEGKSKLMHR
jgi:thymidylate kinase